MIVILSPNTPKLEAPAPRPAAARAREVGFASIMSRGGDLSDPTTTLAFSETGVFGRGAPVSAKMTGSTPAPLLLSKRLPDQAAASATSVAPTSGVAPGAANSAWLNKAASGPSGQFSHSRPASRPPQRPSVAAVRISAATQTAPTVSETPQASMASMRALRRMAPPLAAARANAVNVAFHEIGRAAEVIARVGRMTPTERGGMRQAIAHLLARHGFYGAKISLTE